MSMNDRRVAHKILMNVLEKGQTLSQVLASTPKTSAFSKALVFGVCRQYFRLEKVLSQLLRKKNTNLALQVTLMMGLYQLAYTRQAKYAVVQETVAMLDALGLSWAKGLVNAILRGFERDSQQILQKLAEDPIYQYGHPAWMLAQWQQDWPLHWRHIAEENDQHPPMSLRVNLARITRAEYHEKLAEEAMEAELHPAVPSAIIVKKPCPVEELPGFREGLLSLQDCAAQRSAFLLAAEPGQRVLDACCAPGGKTCHLLEQQPALAECLAIDVDARRLSRVTENLQRLQLQAHLQVADAAHPEQWWDGRYFDRILLDAPCTASGVIRRQPDIRLHRTEQDVDAAAALQKTLLYALWPLLAVGGRLLYATCSVFKKENEHQIAAFLAEHADAHALPLSLESGQAETYGWQFLPGDGKGDGFYYALIEKR
ncbi:MAG: 16S rRNA (cytosine(967)-C(5))-methyltransferase RsmB [Legionellaceae bacterium]|nr:16S rRNA (cytosine(967)-C(5))-methyltransferase RsmB [Legionellaceae bacterium]